MQNKRFLSFLLALLLILTTFTGCDDILDYVSTSDGDTTESTTLGDLFGDDSGKEGETTTPPTQVGGDDTTSGTDPDPIVPSGSYFAVHFIDVGQADAALVMCDGKTMLIDGGNKADSDLIYTYLQKQGVKHIDYMVATHAHEDHVGGLAGALTYATVGTVYCTVKSYDTQAFKNFASKVESRGAEITIPTAGTKFMLGSAEVTILGPITPKCDGNNTSIVLRIVYGERSFLFTGDMERNGEMDLIEAGVTLKSDVLKVGHHGSDTSSTYPFIREVMPTYGIISVGAGNSYGHPMESVLSRYRDAEVQLFRTDMQGDIICTCTDGRTLEFTTARNANVRTNPT